MTLKALIVEDLPADAELAAFELERAGMEPIVRCVETEDQFIRELDEFRPEVILSDFSMPRFSGLAALELAQQRSPATPFIFVSGTIGEDTAIESLKRGATDYILKGNLTRLPSAVRRALQEAMDRVAHQRAEEALRLSQRAVEASINPIIIAGSSGSRHNPILYRKPGLRALDRLFKGRSPGAGL